MPALAALTIYDGASTPVAHVFSPVSIDKGIATLQDRASGVPVGFPTLTLSLQPPKGAGKTYRGRVKITLPILEVLGATTVGFTPAPTPAYHVIGDLTFSIPARSTLADRKDIVAMLANCLANADVKSMVQDLANIY